MKWMRTTEGNSLEKNHRPMSMKTISSKPLSKNSKPVNTTMLQESLKCTKGNTVQIFGSDPQGAYKEGNQVKVNNRTGMTGKYQIGNISMMVRKGVISSLKSVDTKPKTRAVFKN